MNIDMMVFGEDWGKHPSSTQHLIRHVMTEQDVVWVNSLGLRRPRLSLSDFQRAFSKVTAMKRVSATNQATGNVAASPKIVNPRALSWPGSLAVRRINTQLLLRQLKPMMDRSATRPLLWTSLPSAVDLVGHLGERASIYYCGDDFSALDGVDHCPVSQMEQELADKCDLIITASDKLAEKFPAHKTSVLMHGVDTALFGTRAPRAMDMPKGPVAGFYGSIAGWFDQALFIDVARRLKHWTFLLIGPAKCDISALLAEPNVVWLGPKPHHELPQYSQHWDVGLLPFKRNAQIEACNPLKLREYLAAGSPVVTTDYPALDGYRGLINVSNRAEIFASMIDRQQSFSADYKERERMLRKTSVAYESWKSRAEDLNRLLAAYS